MTSLKTGKTGRNCGKPSRRDGVLGAAVRRRIALLRSEGRRLALRAAREPEGCAARHCQQRHVEPGRQQVATYPKP